MDPTTFEYLRPSSQQLELMAKTRIAFAMFASVLDADLPDGADKAYVLRKLRECAMWANVMITRHADGSPRE